MDSRQLDADLVIVGGGPAGAATAIAAAARGRSVILLERDRPGREAPGETLHPGIEPLLVQLRIADRLPQVVGARHRGIWITWGGPSRFEAFGSDAGGPWSGFQVWRADFDALMLARAREVGVEVRQPADAIRPLVDGGVTCGIETSAGPVRARLVVDASGRSRWLGRALGVDSIAGSPRLIARYGHVEGSCPARDDAPALVGDSSGWTWTAMVRPATYQWTRLSFAARPAAGWLPEELRGLTPRGRARGADVTWRLSSAAAGPGWFMVGDAAAMLDPASSHGVLKAILSGVTAGHLAAAILAGAVPPEAAATAYYDWLAGWFAADAARLRQFYRELGAVGFA